MFDLPTTFTDFDKLELEPFANRLTRFIETDHHFVEGALILSLNGSFGCGKSTFFEMWRQKLQAEESARFSPILLNAWDADFLQDALLSIVSGFVRHFKENDKKVDTDGLKESAGKVGKMLLSVGNDIAAKSTGVNLLDAKQAAEKHGEGITGKECFEAFEDRKKAFSDLKELLKKSVEKSEFPIIVMIDELDRCRPDYAVEYLEVIKHIFDIPNLVFVLGVDKSSLASSVRALFGESLNFDEYYRKFAHRNIEFPKSAENALRGFNQSLCQQYLESEELMEQGRFSGAISYSERSADFYLFIKEFSLTPRQIHEMFRILSHCLLKETQENTFSLLESYYRGSVFMICLSLHQPKVYHDIGSGECSIQELVSFLSTLKDREKIWDSYMDWPLMIFTGAIAATKDSSLLFLKLLKESPLYSREEGDEEWIRLIGEYNKLWNGRNPLRRSSPAFQTIYKTIEDVSCFAK